MGDRQATKNCQPLILRICFSAILDLTLAIYPVLIFWSLQLKLNVKIGLVVLFGFGVV